MPPLLLTRLPYCADSRALFAAVADAPWAAFLDSGPAAARRGRVDIIAADPYATLVTRGATTTIDRRGDISRSDADPFDLLRESLGIDPALASPLPFSGGAIGYFSYDLGRRIEPLPWAGEADDLPEMAVGLHDWAVVNDHDRRETWLVGQGRDPLTAQRWADLVQRFSAPPERSLAPFRVTSPVRASMDRAAYGRAFRRIIDYIRAGDCYQVNLTQRFSATAQGDAWTAYDRLRRLNPAPFAAFLNMPGLAVLSSSPERLLRVRDGAVETKPIKGTSPRSDDPVQDAALAAGLRGSVKNQAENLMIVDLLRNDLNKTCAPGSVRVPVLFGIESYTNVHHMVSTVTGELRAGEDALSLLRGCFPGGSITGAPKLRAMQIIDELEPHRRSVYCGAIGYIGFNGDMDTNIAIRTLAYAGEAIHCWAGGGIVLDSDEEDEYAESLVKARAMLRLLAESADPGVAAAGALR